MEVMRTLNAKQVKKLLDQYPDTQLVMTLSPLAFQKAHIPGSTNISDIQTAIQQFSKETKIIVYCSDHSCMASYAAYQQLEQAGYQNIWRFSGGLVEWSEAGFSLEGATEKSI